MSGTNDYKLKYGAHLSLGAPGYIEELIERCGLSAVQIFISNPRSFNPVFSQKSLESLNALKKRHDIFLCVHMPYVANLASNDESLRAKSVEHIISALNAASELGASYYVAHPGSGPYENLADSFGKIIKNTENCRTKLLLENTEGSGNKLFGGEEQMADFIGRFGAKAGICWDTAHAHGAGIDTLGLSETLRGAIKLVHLNDSRVAFASHKDRHDGFSTGTIGAKNIGEIIRLFKNQAPFIIEREGREATCADLEFIRAELFKKRAAASH
ncbi:MAG TPA: TIM barrel protein [Candidatus Wallbacteria bacterium]|nr:TIM barrel protein [Candidatus Wallbacteria bacterium]